MKNLPLHLKCIFCGAVAYLIVETFGIYKCEQCGREIQHYHEPVRTSQTYTPYNSLSGTAASGVTTITIDLFNVKGDTGVG